MHCEIVRNEGRFAELGERWVGLEDEAAAGVFLSYEWLSAYWRAYHGVDELRILTAWEGDELQAVWPLHLRARGSGPLRVRELRLLGDLSGAERSLLCRPGLEEPAALAFVEALLPERDWDVLDAPVVAVRVAGAFERAGERFGIPVERTEAVGRSYFDLDGPSGPDWESIARVVPRRSVAGAVFAPADLDVPFALEELQRLLRKEWAAKDQSSPAADPQTSRFLASIVPELHQQGRVRLGLVGLEGLGAIAADLVVLDGERDVQLLRGTDPEQAPAGATEQLLWGSVTSAVQRRARRFEFADEELPLRSRHVRFARFERIRMWNITTLGRLHRSVDSLRIIAQPTKRTRREPSLVPTALRALDRLREAAPEVVQRAMAKVASYTTLHLYRGELFTRGVLEPPSLSLRLFPREDFDALSKGAREEFIDRLDLQEGYCRQKWSRGDTVVVATLAGRWAGVVWCARSPVYVPDIGREVRPSLGECYIHDVYVHPDERGQKVAPAMLDFLARHLRERDVYRAWALIERANVSSTRAFERASYTAVADVICAKMALGSRILVRPPDPEARQFLGL